MMKPYHNKTSRPMIIRDPVHKDIVIEEPIIKALIDTKEMQRLRRIGQVSGVQYAFPGATHTRFMHCIGVYHLVKQILANPFFSNEVTLTQKQKLKVAIAGLLHDVGHGPFSHTFELLRRVNKVQVSHEEYGQLLISDEASDIKKIFLQFGFEQQDILDICDIIQGKPCRFYQGLEQLVSSHLDADRMDYLLRDNHYAGTGYGYTDHQFIIRNLRLIEGKLCFPLRVIYAIENYLIGRYHMYKQVYNHPVTHGFDILFMQWFQRLYDVYHSQPELLAQVNLAPLANLLNNQPANYEQYMHLDNAYVMELIKNLFDKVQEPILKELCGEVLQRGVFRILKDEQAEQEAIAFISKQYGKEGLKYFFVENYQKEITIYKENKKALFMINDQNEIVPFSKVSNIFLLKPVENLFKKKIILSLKKDQKIY